MCIDEYIYIYIHVYSFPRSTSEVRSRWLSLLHGEWWPGFVLPLDLYKERPSMINNRVKIRAPLKVNYDLHIVELQGVVTTESQKELDNIIRGWLIGVKKQVIASTAL